MKDPKFRQLFAEALRATGIDVQASAPEIATFADQLAIDLAAAAGEAGIGEAIDASADRLVQFASRRTVRVADAGDQRALALVRGVLIGLASG